jgi:hypothetical protein
MFGNPTRLSPADDLHLTEADVVAQLPAIAHCQANLPTQDWESAWQIFLKQTRQEETHR